MSSGRTFGLSRYSVSGPPGVAWISANTNTETIEQQRDRLRDAASYESHGTSRRERNRHPASLPERLLDGVDQLLHVRRVVEVALVLATAAQNLVEKHRMRLA